MADFLKSALQFWTPLSQRILSLVSDFKLAQWILRCNELGQVDPAGGHVKTGPSARLGLGSKSPPGMRTVVGLNRRMPSDVGSPDEMLHSLPADVGSSRQIVREGVAAIQVFSAQMVSKTRSD